MNIPPEATGGGVVASVLALLYSLRYFWPKPKREQTQVERDAKTLKDYFAEVRDDKILSMLTDLQKTQSNHYEELCKQSDDQMKLIRNVRDIVIRVALSRGLQIPEETL